ncbi:MAG TPA: Hsp20/alpha crystallin family protein [Longimicrobiales bacterium]|nr:Hsp20/alpha crystallin family protein [Longimicrobiales bacterium]
MKIARYRAGYPETLWPAVDMPNRLQRLMNDALGQLPTEPIGWFPAVDIVETDTELMLTADLPGMKEEDIDIELNEGVLVVKGEKKEEKEEKEIRYRVVERTWGAFERSFSLPRSVDIEKITAEFANGVLKVHLPKTQVALGRKVAIGKK